MNDAPSICSVWRHTSGVTYRVAMITNANSTKPEYPPTVVYINTSNRTTWSRPVADWNRSMTRVNA